MGYPIPGNCRLSRVGLEAVENIVVYDFIRVIGS